MNIWGGNTGKSDTKRHVFSFFLKLLAKKIIYFPLKTYLFPISANKTLTKNAYLTSRGKILLSKEGKG